jgi:predicted Zn-dependent protease
VADRLVADAEMLLDDDEDDIEDALDTGAARLLAANSWAEMGKLRYAQKLAADVLSDEPDNPAAFLTLGMILIGTGDRANALMALGEVRALLGDADFSEAGLLLGALQLSNADGVLSTDRDSVARGIAELSSFVDRFPRRIAARHLILAAALSIGKADVAREQWAAIGEVNEWVPRQGGDLGALGQRVS